MQFLDVDFLEPEIGRGGRNLPMGEHSELQATFDQAAYRFQLLGSAPGIRGVSRSDCRPAITTRLGTPTGRQIVSRRGHSHASHASLGITRGDEGHLEVHKRARNG